MEIIDLYTSLRLFLYLLVATILGGLVGYEREQAGKAAGIRTHGMVSLGAALFTIVSEYGFGGVGDPGRLAAQVVTGIGFLGAGAILHRRGNIKGLTTAATLWVTAAIGLAVGAGMLILPVTATLLVFGLLRFGPHTSHKNRVEREEED